MTERGEREEREKGSEKAETTLRKWKTAMDGLVSAESCGEGESFFRVFPLRSYYSLSFFSFAHFSFFFFFVFKIFFIILYYYYFFYIFFLKKWMM